jgi:hypothetical protein
MTETVSGGGLRADVALFERCASPPYVAIVFHLNHHEIRPTEPVVLERMQSRLVVDVGPDGRFLYVRRHGLPAAGVGDRMSQANVK